MDKEIVIELGGNKYLYDPDTKLWYIIYLRAINVIHPNHIIQKLWEELNKKND